MVQQDVTFEGSALPDRLSLSKPRPFGGRPRRDSRVVPHYGDRPELAYRWSTLFELWLRLIGIDVGFWRVPKT